MIQETGKGPGPLNATTTFTSFVKIFGYFHIFIYSVNPKHEGLNTALNPLHCQEQNAGEILFNAALQVKSIFIYLFIYLFIYSLPKSPVCLMGLYSNSLYLSGWTDMQLTF